MPSIIKTLNFSGKLLTFEIPKIMGVLNVTPDSFYGESRVNTEKEIVKKAEKMLADGADFFDVGGYSSRPGATDLPEPEEWIRVSKGITTLKKHIPDALISVDTFRSEIARKAVDAGACMVNDISGGSTDKKMFKTIAELKVPFVVMHMKGTPQTMQKKTRYRNLLTDMMSYFIHKIKQLENEKFYDIIIDPGFGFAKNIEQNYCVLNNLNYFSVLNRPIMVGLSRKSMIYKLLNTTPEQALNGTVVVNTIALLNGADILRVHDVKEAREVVKIFCALKTEGKKIN